MHLENRLNVILTLTLSTISILKALSSPYQSLCITQTYEFMKTTLLDLAMVWICRSGLLIESSTPCGEKPKHLLLFLLGDCCGVTLRSCVVTREVYLGFVRCKIIGNTVAFSMLRFKLAQLSPSHLNLDVMTFKYSFA